MKGRSGWKLGFILLQWYSKALANNFFPLLSVSKNPSRNGFLQSLCFYYSFALQHKKAGMLLLLILIWILHWQQMCFSYEYIIFAFIAIWRVNISSLWWHVDAHKGMHAREKRHTSFLWDTQSLFLQLYDKGFEGRQLCQPSIAFKISANTSAYYCCTGAFLGCWMTIFMQRFCDSSKRPNRLPDFCNWTACMYIC